MYLLTSLCENSNALNAIYLVKVAISMITIIVPIALIISLMVSILKYISNGDDSAAQKLKTSAVNRIVSAVIVFIVPLGVNLLLQMLNTGGSFHVCYENATSDYIAQRKQEEKLEKEAEKAKRAQEVELKKQQAASKPASRPASPDGGASGTGPESQSTTKYANQLVYYNQGNYDSTYICYASQNCNNDGAKTIRSSGCGHTSLTMMAATFGNKRYTPVDMRNILCEGVGKNIGYVCGALGTGYFTNSTLLNELGLIGENIVPSSYNGYKTYNGTHAEAILRAVQAGKGVVLYIPGHYVALGQHPSCTTNQVYLYDPGASKNNGCYTMKQLWDKTYDNKSRCTDSNGTNCGWKGAWAYVGK